MTATIRQAVVLCAGEGRRLRPFTHATPKPLIPLLNVPLIEHVVTGLARAGVERIVMNAWWRAEQILEWVRTAPIPGVQIDVVCEPVLLGTGGGLAGLARHLGDGPVFVTTADVVGDVDWQALARHHEQCEAIATMAIATRGDTARYGLVAGDADGQLVDIVELVDGDAARTAPLTGVNASWHVLERALFDRLPTTPPSCLVRDGYVPAMRAGEVLGAYAHHTAWAEIGTPELLVAAHVAALDGELPLDDALVARGGTRHDVYSRVSPSASLGRDVRLVRTAVGPGAVIGDGAVLRDCVVMAGAQVASRSEHVAEVLASLGVPA